MERVVVEVETKTKENINWINSNGVYLAPNGSKSGFGSILYVYVCVYIFNKLICEKPNKFTYRWNYNYFIYLFSKYVFVERKICLRGNNIFFVYVYVIASFI